MDKLLMQYEVGEQLTTFLFLKSATKGIASNGSAFLTLILQDKSGEMDAKLWSVGKKEEDTYVAGKVVKIQGDIHEFKGRKQLKLSKIRLSNDEDGILADDFMEKAPLSKEVMMKEVQNYIDFMKNDNLKRITSRLLAKYRHEFMEFPAATKNHHEFMSGLAYHVVSMLKLAKAIANQYPSLDKDLLYAGIILHDLGKVIELSGPIATTYTVKGNLLGHISIMVTEIGKAAEDLKIDGEEVIVLQHIVLSHHGKAEWGSPKPPMIKEAEVIHYIDNLDAKINMLDRVLEHVKPGEYSERVFALENRNFYKPKF